MRLSDFEEERALDLLADLIEPAAEIMNDQKVVGIVRSGKPVLYAVKEILKSHKEAAMQIVAAIHGTTPDKVKFNVLTLAKDILELMNDPELLQVFTYQSQTDQEISSGSAMENTEDSGK